MSNSLFGMLGATEDFHCSYYPSVINESLTRVYRDTPSATFTCSLAVKNTNADMFVERFEYGKTSLTIKVTSYIKFKEGDRVKIPSLFSNFMTVRSVAIEPRAGTLGDVFTKYLVLE